MYLYENSIFRLTRDFTQMISEIMTEGKVTADFLAELDAKSSTTFKHSINVAFQFYVQAVQDGVLSGDRLKNWVMGAMLHDVGKLSTPGYILHGSRLSDSEHKIMMEHSIKGKYFLSKVEVPKEVVAAVTGHHLSSKSVHSHFEGAELSRNTWSESFKEGYIQKLIKENLSWMEESKEDIYALSLLSFLDCCEAERADYRHYKNAFEWGNKEIPGSILYCMDSDVMRGTLDAEITGRVSTMKFQKMFDALQSIEMDVKVREIMLEKGFTRVPVYTQDKMKDIEMAPETGLLFYEKATSKEGTEVFVIRPKQLNPKEPVSTDCLIVAADRNGSPDIFAKPVLIPEKEFIKNYTVIESERKVQKEKSVQEKDSREDDLERDEY